MKTISLPLGLVLTAIILPSSGAINLRIGRRDPNPPPPGTSDEPKPGETTVAPTSASTTTTTVGSADMETMSPNDKPNTPDTSGPVINPTITPVATVTPETPPPSTATPNNTAGPVSSETPTGAPTTPNPTNPSPPPTTPAQTAPPTAPSTGSVTALANYCGSDAGDALKCGIPCPGGISYECPTGEYCYAGIPCPVEEGNPVVMANYCGSDAGDALKCGVQCPGGQNNECPAGEFCYAAIPCPGGTEPAISPPPVVQANYCGLVGNWADAEKCQTPCPKGLDSECPNGEACYAFITCPATSN